ncbi:hypothetical protein NESM_000612500 [Novymonas esmeraldas]|uniref:Uncharacterized protein n=1 Tax=Novymonas esmeraldas TaxID=1808958 RepID=A0AAW0ERE5_9TRYP
MHIYSKDQQAFHLQRTRAEKWWSRANTLIVIVQLACFLSAIIRTGTSSSRSMTNSLFIVSVLELQPPYIVEGCVYQVARRHAFFNNVRFTMSKDNVGYFVSRSVLNIRYLMALTGVHIVVSAVNRLWFETNTHEVRYHFVVFRKDMVTTWEVLLMVLGLVVTLGVTQENQILSNYVAYCAVGTNTASVSLYNSIPPYTELIVSYIVSMAVTGINIIFAVWNLSRENPRDAMLRETQQRHEEWERAMAEQYGVTDPTAASAAAAAAQQLEGHAGGTQPQVIHADNRATTVHPGAAATAAGGEAGAPLPPSGEQPPPPLLPPHHHHHGYGHAVRAGLAHPFSSLSTNLRRRTHTGEALNLEEPTPPHAQAAQQPLAQQQQPFLQTVADPPHVGPSVSRPLTPLLNEEFNMEGEEMAQRDLFRGGSGGRAGPPLPVLRGPSGVAASSSSGGYDLHEVGDDEDDVETSSALRGGRGSSSAAGGGGAAAAVAGRGRGASESEASTGLLAARLASVPPPPPAYSGDRRQSAYLSRSKMLAPPSPLQGGAETTDDTVHL